MSDLELGGGEGQPDPEEALRRFITAQRIHALYPARNPKVLATIGELREGLSGYSASSPLEILVTREHLLYRDLPLLSGQNETQELARKLYLASITALLFEADVTEDEVLAFLEILRLSDDQRRELGSLVDELQRRGVKHIQVREAGHVSIEEAGEGSGDPWDLTSLDELEALEMAILGEGASAGFHEQFRAVAEGDNPKAARLLGLLHKPAEFATLLLDTASLHRVRGNVDLDAQLGFMIELIARLEPVIQRLQPTDQSRLYRRLTEVVTTIERSIYRELMEVATPPYIRLGKVAQLFPEKMRPLTVKEALGLGLGPGLMPFLMGALRHIAEGDDNVPEFLGGDEAKEDDETETYQPVPLPPAPPTPPQLGAPFFQPLPGGRTHPGEAALAAGLKAANSTFDSIATVTDLLAAETDEQAYAGLVDQVVRRFSRALALGNFPIASQMLRTVFEEWERRAPAAGEAMSPLASTLMGAYDRFGSPETMRDYLDAIAGIDDPAKLEKAAEPLLGLTPTAIASLMHLLADEPDRDRRLKLLDIISTAGKRHVDAVVAAKDHEQWFVVRNMVCILARWGSEYTERILEAADHPDPRVRKEVIRSLAQWRGPEISAGLAQFVSDSEDSVIRESLKALVEAGDATCLPALHAEVESERFGGHHPATIAAIVRALGTLGDATSAKLLNKVLDTHGEEPWLKPTRLKKLFAEAAESIAKRTSGGGA